MSGELRTLVDSCEDAKQIQEMEGLIEDAFVKATRGPREARRMMIEAAVESMRQIEITIQDDKVEHVSKIMDGMMRMYLNMMVKGGQVEPTKGALALVQAMKGGAGNGRVN